MSSSDQQPSEQNTILLGITGASGSIYGEVFLRFLLQATSQRIYLVVTPVAQQVINFELKATQEPGSLARLVEGSMLEQENSRLRLFSSKDFFAPIASGTAAAHSMVVLPCSMGSAARIATGMSSNLLERAADVMLKQHRSLIIAPRESPLSTLHLQNLLNLSQMGAKIVPLMPAMYQRPQSVEDVVRFSVGRVCELLRLEHAFYAPWNKRRS